jgi:hypothetical protein
MKPMKRIVTYTEELGVFSVDCAECPLIPHLKALDQPSKPCLSGMVTNMQGHMPIYTCKHYQKDSITNEPGQKLSVICNQ